jgi:hypothetical protein
MTKTETTELDKLLRPTIGPFVAVIEGLAVITAFILMIIWFFSQAAWALSAAALVFGFVAVMYLIDTRLIAEDNQKRLDFLIKNR